MPNLLFIGTPQDCIPAMARAVGLGYSVYAVDGDPTSNGLAWVKKWGHGADTADIYDFHWIHKTVLKNTWKIDAVLAVGTDIGPVVSLVAKGLGLPHISYNISKLSWNKVELKRVLRQAGINVPRTADFVTKPIDGRGSRGVSVVSASNLWGAEWEAAKRSSPTGRVMCEEWIEGDGVSAEAIVWDSNIIFCGLTDRVYDVSKTVESGGFGPSKYEGKSPGVLCHLTIIKAIKALGIKFGTAKFDLILDERTGNCVVLEAALGRMGGGYNFDYLEKSYGVNFLEMAFSTYCGQDPRPLMRIEKGCFVAGRYEMNGNPSKNGERGEFKMVTGETREEAERKLGYAKNEVENKSSR